MNSAEVEIVRDIATIDPVPFIVLSWTLTVILLGGLTLHAWREYQKSK